MALVAISEGILLLLLVNLCTLVSSAPLSVDPHLVITPRASGATLSSVVWKGITPTLSFHTPITSISDFTSTEAVETFMPTLPIFLFTVPPSVLSPTSGQEISFVTVIEPAATVTVQDSPQTVLITITDTVIASTSVAPTQTHQYTQSFSSSSSPPSSSSPVVTSRSTHWALPPQFTSVEEAFNIDHFAYGKENVRLVQFSEGPMPSIYQYPVGTNAIEIAGKRDGQTVLQVNYPRGSYSPSHKPRGGADFYSTPPFHRFEEEGVTAAVAVADDGNRTVSLEMLKKANNVTLSYSVYFPPDFDFVKGGKLPGLYGGHRKCSGGDDALDCFSTRLMWRGGGKGELYLYAPKDIQSDSLCATPPRSNCDTVYGLSIGRGSFDFERGMWTHVRQTVWLNSIGRRNGGFVLEIGAGDDKGSMKRVLSNAEVYYRSAGGESYEAISWEIDDFHAEDDDPLWEGSHSSNGDGRQRQQTFKPPLFDTPELYLDDSVTDSSSASAIPNWNANADGLQPQAVTVYAIQGTKTVTVPNFSTVTSTVTVARTVFTEGQGREEATASATPRVKVIGRSETGNEPTGFAGIFFSTFFGGSTPDWASPKDQYVLFKDFQVTING
ncbi:hypothetical protein FRC16_005838 [Serendipita sp. 398]|nr:hypothetical protein FRC16_005838 [Serendipita sp. 398]